VDRARASVARGDGASPLADAYGALMRRVLDAREQENRAFAERLAVWTKVGSTSDDLLPAEHVLDRIVAPLASKSPVLLLVLDGMSQAVFRRLVEDLEEAGWLSVRPADSGRLAPVIAPLPTVTSVARSSLLRGRLGERGSGDEQRDFEAHPALVAASAKKSPPRLFHEADLGRGNALPVKTRQQLEGDRRVFGVVVNAIDDHLTKGDQVHVDWSLQTIHPLAELLEAARLRGRVVILTSDHGHLPDRDTELVRREGAEARYRPAPSPTGTGSDAGTGTSSGIVAEGEVLLEGPRVVAPEGRIIAAWSERIRYGRQQAGYHGGASPQEVVVPLAVLAPAGVEVDGWVEVPFEVPSWWDPGSPVEAGRVAHSREDAAEDGSSRGPDRPDEKKARPKSIPFERTKDSLPFKTATEVSAPPADWWVARLLESETYALQRRSAARLIRGDDAIRALLDALDEAGGALTRRSVAQRVGLPEIRLAGFLEGVRRVLNLDGYEVLEIDEESDSIRLNLELLLTQFDLRE